MKIRAAVSGDLPAIAKIHAESWKDTYKSILPAAYLRKNVDDDLRRRWDGIEIGPEDCVLVAENADIVGFIAVWCRPDPFIDNLHVSPEMRSNGAGAMLMEKAADMLMANGKSTAYLHVMADNPRAIVFYERLGGKVVGETIKEFFGNETLNKKIEWANLMTIKSALGRR